ncbi:YraN family protein [Prosthecochloris sp. CIB 2401]|uniref:YraN family protein n=1 Tax=Prosthecochloris sp. CIB 2401 TaxID=1868325 RepID=UPI00080AA520|nr:YraN family protein [Prosthecochloris sp. CIB 2401]ANT63839.1 hypothetical protein Ptc2401_00016 [Prosthecochloris sp. CIB 2401]
MHNDLPHDLGRKGEETAAAMLVDKGYHIVERNYRHKRTEIDIIAMDGRTLCFIEVKTRSSISKGHPLDAVEKHKQREIIRTARAYLALHYGNREFPDCRFDVIGILWESVPEIIHIEDAFWI